MTDKWTTADFPIGMYHLNADQSVNFQMNRFFNWSNDREMLKQMKKIGNDQQTYPQLIAAFEDLGEKALSEGEKLRAALYFRAAEFYLPDDAPDKKTLRDKFISLNNAYYGIGTKQHFLIPYATGHISAYRLTPTAPRGTILFINGFDGYIEELTRMMMVFRDAGYDVIYFDGPGQGYALEEERLAMTHQWEKPVKAVLDYFDVDDVTAVGMSLGGNLVLRAAAFEKRIKRAVCFDVLPDFYTCITNQLPNELKVKLARTAIIDRNKDQINTLLTQLMKHSLMLQWALQQGTAVMGVPTAYDFLKQSLKYTTAKISASVDQDILLLAGANDHYVPNNQLPLQIDWLTHARSMTARRFTNAECASSHCQLGNVGLALTTILDWLDQLDRENASLAQATIDN